MRPISIFQRLIYKFECVLSASVGAASTDKGTCCCYSLLANAILLFISNAMCCGYCKIVIAYKVFSLLLSGGSYEVVGFYRALAPLS